MSDQNDRQLTPEEIQRRRQQQQMRMRMLAADPFDTEAQRLIAEEIKRQNIESNMEAALEYHPESYGTVTMLYINCKINGHPVKAFVDSGAQSTIMSMACAERCSLTRLLDSRWSGIAKGVGTQRIIGRIHLCQVQIEKDFLASSLTILQDQPMDMLLGLDMLKRHQCSIDLKANVLRIGTTGSETKFLDESEIPEFAKSKNEGVSESGMNAGVSESEAMDDDAMIAEALRRSAAEASSVTTNGAVRPPNESSRRQHPESSRRQHPESVIKQMTEMGFPRSSVIQELDNFNGDPNQAIAALLAKSLVVPSILPSGGK